LLVVERVVKVKNVVNVGKSWKRYKMLWMLRDCESDIASTNFTTLTTTPTIITLREKIAYL